MSKIQIYRNAIEIAIDISMNTVYVYMHGNNLPCLDILSTSWQIIPCLLFLAVVGSRRNIYLYLVPSSCTLSF